VDFEFSVGNSEKHTFRIQWSQSSGFGQITVDGQRVKRIFEMLSASTTRKYSLSVGTAEVHQVEIEKVRQRAFGGFAPQTCRAYVDGTSVGEWQTA
jgi:hypothetical protein